MKHKIEVAKNKNIKMEIHRINLSSTIQLNGLHDQVNVGASSWKENLLRCQWEWWTVLFLLMDADRPNGCALSDLAVDFH